MMMDGAREPAGVGHWPTASAQPARKLVRKELGPMQDDVIDGADVADEITDLNMAYVLLAQKLLRQDRAAGMLRLGISEEAAGDLMALSPHDMLSLCTGDALLCGLRLGAQLRELASSAHARWARQAHLSILLAGAASAGGHVPRAARGAQGEMLQ